MTTFEDEFQKGLTAVADEIMAHVNQEVDRLIGQAFRHGMSVVDICTKVETEEGVVRVTVGSYEYGGTSTAPTPGATRYVLRPHQGRQIPRVGERWRERETGNVYVIEGIPGGTYKLAAKHIKAPWYVSIERLTANFEKVK